MARSLNSSRRGLWSIVGAATLWGTTGVATQAIYDLSSTNALSVAFARLAIAALVLSYPAESWLLLLYMGCIPTALAYVLFQVGMRSTSATLTSILTFCEPLTAAILAWILFGERLSLLGILGALLLLGTIGLLALAKSMPETTQTSE